MNREQLTIKLQAVRAKDTAEIFKQRVYLPNIGVAKSEQEVKDWLKTREEYITELLAAKDDAEVTEKLNDATVKFAKKPEDFKHSVKDLSAADFDSLSKIHLAEYALKETAGNDGNR